MDSNQRMIHWSAAWALVGGIVVCTGCMRGQPITQSGESFTARPRTRWQPCLGQSCTRFSIKNVADRSSKGHPLRETASTPPCIANCAFISATKLAIPRHESN